jgi:hypothetical protein
VGAAVPADDPARVARSCTGLTANAAAARHRAIARIDAREEVTMQRRAGLAMMVVAAAIAGSVAVGRAGDADARGPSVFGEQVRASLRAELAARRDRMIHELHRYWIAGAFPVNVYQPRMVNIFRDDLSRLCAVANLIHASGRDDLIDAQVAADNYLALRDLPDHGPIADWIASSGLTREEIVAVQGLGYQFVQELPGRPRNDRLAVLMARQRERQIALERAALRTRLSAAETTLRAGGRASLDVAVDGLLARAPTAGSRTMPAPAPTRDRRSPR